MQKRKTKNIFYEISPAAFKKAYAWYSLKNSHDNKKYNQVKFRIIWIQNFEFYTLYYKLCLEFFPWECFFLNKTW